MSTYNRLKDALKIYLDKAAIKDIIAELRATHDTKTASSLDVFFDPQGNLLRWEPNKFCRDYSLSSGYGVQNVPSPDWRPPEPNRVFIDAIQCVGRVDAGQRKGAVKFRHLDGRTTYLHEKFFEDNFHKLICGWLFGQFTYRVYYGYYTLDVLETYVV